MNITPGMIVQSKAGRDQQRFYVVVGLGGGWPLIADGKRRRAEKPKRKNPCHLSATSQTVSLAETDTNPKIRRALQGLNGPAASAVH